MRTLPLLHAEGVRGSARRIIPAGVIRCLDSGLLQVVVDSGGVEAGEEFVEGLVVVDADGAFAGQVVFVDVDAGEEGVVEQAPGGVVGFEVGGVTVGSVNLTV